LSWRALGAISVVIKLRGVPGIGNPLAFLTRTAGINVLLANSTLISMARSKNLQLEMPLGIKE
jgi:hypothetical protein